MLTYYILNILKEIVFPKNSNIAISSVRMFFTASYNEYHIMLFLCTVLYCIYLVSISRNSNFHPDTILNFSETGIYLVFILSGYIFYIFTLIIKLIHYIFRIIEMLT